MICPSNWKPYKIVLHQQVPLNPGEPIPMNVYDNKSPKNCGDPWIGAYSKHGFWYKFEYGDQNDYEKIVALSFESDEYMLNYESMNIWRSIFKHHFRYIVAKNQRDEVIGSIGYANYGNYAVIGIYYVVEEYRHSGIGTKLFTDAFRHLAGKTVIFHAMSHLKNKCDSFGLHYLVPNWQFTHYVLQNPSGYLELQKQLSNTTTSGHCKEFLKLNDNELEALQCYDSKICGHSRQFWLSQCKFKESVVGYGCIREVSGGYIKRLLVAPLYANSPETAILLIVELCKKYYLKSDQLAESFNYNVYAKKGFIFQNPDEDYEWDPDITAIYRRNVHFIVPTLNSQMNHILKTFCGSSGTLTAKRLFYEVFEALKLYD
uniref:N-acetyltransferase domain-containing protein n=1 Tax=Syphacia muris TaxID=451379 RepID=A0A0N5AP37_9BILA